MSAPEPTRHVVVGIVGKASNPSGFQPGPSLSTNRVEQAEVGKGGRCIRENPGAGIVESRGGTDMTGGDKRLDSRLREEESRTCEDLGGRVTGRGQWRQAVSASKGRPYWFNPVTGESRWELQPELPKQQLLPDDDFVRAAGGKRAGDTHAGKHRALKTAKTHDSKNVLMPSGMKDGPVVCGAPLRLPLTTAGGLEHGATSKAQNRGAAEAIGKGEQCSREQAKQGGIARKPALPRIPVRGARTRGPLIEEEMLCEEPRVISSRREERFFNSVCE